MRLGNRSRDRSHLDAISPIVLGIRHVETLSRVEIRVFLTQKRFEKDVIQRASRILDLISTLQPKQEAPSNLPRILLYINLRRKMLALITDPNTHEAIGQEYCRNFAEELGWLLRSTHYERAVKLALVNLGEKLKESFPRLH